MSEHAIREEGSIESATGEQLLSNLPARFPAKHAVLGKSIPQSLLLLDESHVAVKQRSLDHGV